MVSHIPIYLFKFYNSYSPIIIYSLDMGANQGYLNKLTNPTSRTLKMQNISEELNKCQQLQTFQCPIYNTLHKVSWKGQEFSMGKSATNLSPQQHSIHYLLSPNVLIIPPYQTLQSIKFSHYDTLKQIVSLLKAMASLGSKYEVGFGRNRIGYSVWTKQWGTLGQNLSPYWNYHKILKEGKSQKVYLSPELMKAFSKDKIYPKVNVKKSDVFVLAIMMLQVIFGQDLQEKVYEYQDSQIKLKPILQKMALLQEQFPESIYNLFINMLQFDPEQRISFQSLEKELQKINVNQTCVSSPLENQRLIKFNDCTPTNTKSQLSPVNLKIMQPRNSDLRGRSPGVIRKNIQTDRTQQRISLSPLRTSNRNRRSSKCNNLIFQQSSGSNLYRVTPKREKIWEGVENQRPSVQPFGLKPTFNGPKAEKARKPIIQRLRS